MPFSREVISVETLKKVNILYQGHIYALAKLFLHANDVRGKGTDTIYRHTVHGLAVAYSRLTHADYDYITSVRIAHRIPLGATVEHSKNTAQKGEGETGEHHRSKNAPR